MAGIDWYSNDPDAAFARARESGLPLLLYWGAAWCPPCNRLEGGTFNRPDFVALAPSFVALRIDGDSPAGQMLAERFKVRSYPTLVVYRPDGTEVTRLPCELDGKRFVQLFELALGARFTVSESLSVALSRERVLSDDEWRLLGFYAWNTDEHQLIRNLDFAATIASMARACTLPDAAVRLEWLTLHAAAMAGTSGIDQRAAIVRLETTLTDAQAVYRQLDIVNGYAVDLVRFLTTPGSRERDALIAVWSAALEGLENDATLNIAAQLGALRTRVQLSRLGSPVAGLGDVVRQRVTNGLDAVHEAAMRHFVINAASGVLADAGLPGDAEQLLTSTLEHSHAPFYFMHNLADIARQRGDPALALRWYEQAWRDATGPATRLQWGATYLESLLDCAPQEAPRIERLAHELHGLLASMPDASRQRNRTQMQRIDAGLARWGGSGEHSAALRRAARTVSIQMPFEPVGEPVPHPCLK
jgi:thiol-disulfide isomerase/thioredoxin